jgi:hypothetical protein
MKRIITFILLGVTLGITSLKAQEEIVIPHTVERLLVNPFDDKKTSSELVLSKKFTGESIESSKIFDVESNASSLDINLSGSTKSGKIIIRLIMPDGKDLKTLEIDPASDVRWMKRFDLTDKSRNLTGQWKLIINTEKADGSYRLFVSTR